MKGEKTEILHSILEEVRSAGSADSVDQVLEKALPNLLTSCDPHQDAKMSESGRDAGLDRLRLAAQSPKQSHIPLPPSFWVLLRWPMAAACAAVIYAYLNFLPPNGTQNQLTAGSGAVRSKGTGANPKETPKLLPPSVTAESFPPTKPNANSNSGMRLVIAPKKEPQVGRFYSVQGEPMLFALGSKAGQIAKQSSPIGFGSCIESGDADTAILEFNEGTRIKLEFNTRLEIPPLESFGTNIAQAVAERRPRLVKLVSGRVHASVTHLDDAPDFKIETPSATAKVLGTEFSLEHSRDPAGSARTHLKVNEGRVEFFNSLGKTQLGKRFESQAEDGSAPTEPKRVIAYRTFIFGLWYGYEIGATDLTHGEAIGKLAGTVGTIGATIGSTPEGEIWITEVEPNSPTSAVGLHAGSLLVVVNGQPNPKANFVRSLIADGVGNRIVLRTVRDGQVQEFSIPIGPSQRKLVGIASKLTNATIEATRPLLYGDAKTARRRLESLVKVNRDATVLNNLGVAAELLDNTISAVRYFTKAIRLSPNEPLYRANLGGALKAIGNLARAEQEFQRALVLSPENVVFRLELAEILSLQNKHDESLSVVGAATNGTRTERARLLIQESFVFARSWRMEQAESKAREASELTPELSAAWCQLAQSLNGQERYREALEPARTAFKLDPTSAKAAFDLGIAAGCSMLPEGPDYERRASELAPKVPEYRHNYLSTLFYFYRSEQAISKYMEDSFWSGAGEIGVQAWRITLLGLKGRLSEAESVYREAMKQWPDDPRLMRHMAMAFGYSGKQDEAISMLEEAIELHPNYLDLRQNLVGINLSKGTQTEALMHLNEIIKQKPDFAGPYADIGISLLWQERSEEALSLYEKVRELSSTFPWSDPNVPQYGRGFAIDLVLHHRLEAVAQAALKGYRDLPATVNGATRESHAATYARALLELRNPKGAEKFCRDFLEKYGSTERLAI